MDNSHRQESDPSESVLKQHLRREVDRGMAMAVDPANANLPDLAIRTTTINSPWYARTCRVCRDKFREGDRVRLCPRCGEPYHDDRQYDLHCWQEHFVGGRKCTEGGPDRFNESGREIPSCDYVGDGRLPDDPAEDPPFPQDTGRGTPPAAMVVTQFVTGLETVWHPFGKQQTIKVAPRSSLVGRNCPWCRFRVRAGDWVVECPCGTDCGTYFHQDVFRHLTCWNEWNGVAGNDYCPTTGAVYGKQQGGQEDQEDGC